MTKRRPLAVVLAAGAASLTCAVSAQGLAVTAPTQYTDSQAVAAVSAAGFVTGSQLATQSASDIATAGTNVPTQASAAGFLTSVQTQALLSQIAQSFVPGFTPVAPGTMASLLSTAPASATNVGKYAVVSDLFGGTNEVLRSGYTAGFGYYWRPQRTDYGTSVAASGGALTLTPLVNSPYIYLSGQLASSLTINLSNTNAWPGASFCVSNNLTLGLATLNVAGTGLPSTNMIGGASKCFVFDGNSAAWRPF